jgi:hypothetical protein
MIQFSIFTVAEVSYSALPLFYERQGAEGRDPPKMRISAVQQRNRSPLVLLEHCSFFSADRMAQRREHSQASDDNLLVRGSAPAKPAQRQDK